MNALTLPEVRELAAKSVDSLMEKMSLLEQADCPVLHHFHDGIYIRELRMPAGIVAVGHIQRHPQMNVFVQGRVQMLNPDGTTTELAAPMTFVGSAGRKVGYVIEDVIWQNIYPNPDNERDIEVLEARWLEKTPLVDQMQMALLPSPNDDYQQMLDDLGITAELVNAESVVTNDLIDMPPSWVTVAVRSSPIHGKGLFAEANLAKNEMICPMRIDGKRTPAGRYTNHSGTPNAKVIRMFDNDFGLVALRDIHGRRGGLNGEEITVDYRQVKEAICQE
jgi:hypothetical protein